MYEGETHNLYIGLHTDGGDFRPRARGERDAHAAARVRTAPAARAVDRSVPVDKVRRGTVRSGVQREGAGHA